MSGAERARRRRPPASPAPWGPMLWGLGYIAVGVALAALAAWPIFHSPRVVVIAAAGWLLGVGIVVLARVLRWGAFTASAVLVAVYLLAAVPLAVPDAMRSPSALAGGLRDALFGVVLGWKQILTLNPPLGEYQAVLVPFLVVVLVGSFSAAMLVGLTGRRAVVAVPIVVAMSLFGIAFGTGVSGASLTIGTFELPAAREWAIGVAVFLSSLVWLLGRTRMARARALRTHAASTVSASATPLRMTVRRHVLSAVIVVVALGAGLGVAPAAGGASDRSVLRDDVDPMVVVEDQVSPLSAYRSWFTSDRLDETVISIDGDTNGIERIGFVTLDAYDGEDFRVAEDTQFSRLPRGADAGSDEASITITIGDGYQGIWLPTPRGLAEAPEFSGSRADALADGFRIDESESTAITIADSPEGEGLVPGDGYTLIVDPSDDGGDVSSASGGDALIDAEDYPALAEWVALQGLPRTGAGYLELISRLTERGYLSHSLVDDEDSAGWIEDLEGDGYSFAASYSGHSASRIEELFSSLLDQEKRVGSDASPAQLVSAVGDDEQFAVAAALLARYLGLESRVVVGVRLADAEEVPGIAPCDAECTGASMSAWVEVRAAGGEWSAVDATPQHAMLPSTVTEGEQLPEYPTSPDLDRDDVLDPPDAQSDSRADATSEATGENTVWATVLSILRIVGWGVLVLVLLLLPPSVLVAGKTVRRRLRRSATDAEVRLVGAWAELVDLYADHGIAMEVSGTRAQRAGSTGRSSAMELAELVDRGVFAPHPPSPGQADAAWALVERERADLHAAGRPWRRMTRLVSPHSFLRAIGASGRGSRGADASGVGTLAVAGADRRRQKGESA